MNWYDRTKTSQVQQRSARYRGVIVYEVRVPAADTDTEKQAADQAAANLYEQIYGVVGDEAVSYDLPEKFA